MRLQTKLIGSQLPLVVALFAIGFLGMMTVGHLGQYASGLLHDNFVDVIALQEMDDVVERLHASSLMRLTGREIDLVGQKRTLKEVFDREMADVAHHPTESGEVELLARLRTSWNDYLSDLDRFVEAAPGTEKNSAFDRMEARFDTLKQLLEEVVTLNRHAMVEKSDNVHRMAERLEILMSVSTFLAILSALLLSLLLVRWLLRPLSILTLAVQRVGQGDPVRVPVGSNDEVGLLSREFNLMSSQLHRLRQDSLQELHQAQQTARATIDSLPDPVLVVDGEGRLLAINRVGRELFGTLPEPGRTVREMAWPGSLTGYLVQVLAHLLSGKGAWLPTSFNEAIPLPLESGTTWFLIRAVPLLGDQGLAGATLVLQDVSRMRRFMELRNDLVATVAHELRTPLTSLHMAIHLCHHGSVGELNDTQTQLLEGAGEDCQRLQTIVDDLLDISRIESGKWLMKREPVNIRELLEVAWQRLADLAHNQGMELILQRSALPAGEVLADGERLGLVLTNLISNALRYSGSGGQVTLGARCEGSRLLVEVSDSGPGIPEEFQQRIFDKFFRVPGIGGSGSGLGLSVCREIVEAHGGQIGVDSKPGQGSRFWFSLPGFDAH
ncbi:MAG: HAMP domain-containing protein [Magnetococcales bacterium]|nr:HAMP domain-containing protein [Magnetococcales bacterium]